MKVLINDYAGHPFQLELSKELAKRGHKVWHAFSDDVEGAKADFTDYTIENLEILPITIGHPVRKYQFHKRIFDEHNYGKIIGKTINKIVPDVVINANTPLDAYKIIRRAENNVGARKVYWLQDMIGYAATKILKGKYIGAGNIIGKRFFNLETKLLQGADQIIAISEGFLPYLENRGIRKDQITVIHNWAPLNDLPAKERDNEWRHNQIGNDKFTFLYAGTLGLKHNPQVLIDLAKIIDSQKLHAQIIVTSEGIGADYLNREIASQAISSMRILPYQPFTCLPDVLGSGDVLITLLEGDAGVFSVPSKILSYMCAARPQLAAMPKENLGSILISDRNCGYVCNPNDSESFIDSALDMYNLDTSERLRLGDNARRFAENNFDIARIADRFEKIF